MTRCAGSLWADQPDGRILDLPRFEGLGVPRSRSCLEEGRSLFERIDYDVQQRHARIQGSGPDCEVRMCSN